MTGPSRFRFLGVERELASPSDWNRKDWPKLWLYNAHYFDDLAASDATERSDWHRALVARWIAENPPGAGNGWEPYPVSLRIVNWVKWALSGNVLDPAARNSLAAQTRWLRQRLEIHLLGNHLWANAKALTFAGCFFEGAEADAWRRKGLDLLRRELAEQILPDGGHFERSPMYHAILLEDVLDLLQLVRTYPGLIPEGTEAAWRETAARMLHWLRVMTHPDGGIALFNDAAFDIAPALSALQAYGTALGVAADTARLPDMVRLGPSGYVRLESDVAVLIADVAPVGPDYLPGHAHADTLSFELSLGGRRLAVNGGTSTYEADAERLRQRGTAAHNTVTVDGQDSSEVWGSFRVARRARPFDVDVRTDAGERCVSGSHNGYRRLPGKPVHHRTWRLSAGGLAIEDRISGEFRQAVARVHVAPEWNVERTGQGVRISGDAGVVEVRMHGAASVEVVDGHWHPRFGQSVPCRVIEAANTSGRLLQEWTWTLSAKVAALSPEQT